MTCSALLKSNQQIHFFQSQYHIPESSAEAGPKRNLAIEWRLLLLLQKESFYNLEIRSCTTNIRICLEDCSLINKLMHGCLDIKLICICICYHSIMVINRKIVIALKTITLITKSSSLARKTVGNWYRVHKLTCPDLTCISLKTLQNKKCSCW